MATQKPEVTDDSTTISDEGGATTETTDVDTIIESSKDEGAVDSSPFQEGEKVLAFHSHRLYEAKVQHVEVESTGWKYFVHYLGWNKSWDEWVGIDRLMKLTEKNIQKQKEINKKQGTDTNEKMVNVSKNKPKNASVARGKKRKNDLDQKEKAVASCEKQVNIHIPAALKKQLVHDYEAITHMGKLVTLPRTPNVSEILNKYLEYQTKKDLTKSDTIEEVINGLRTYFDKALSAMLLYQHERSQYVKAKGNDDFIASNVYGAEHLLRLFVKLPEILYQANIEEVTLVELRNYLSDFLKFMQKNQKVFFLAAYEFPEEEIN